MPSERLSRALYALRSESMPVVLDAVIRANETDNADWDWQEREYKKLKGIDQDAILVVNLEELSEMHELFPVPVDRAKCLLYALSDQFVDALCVVMYAGRDEFTDGHPYDETDVDSQFSEWWHYLGMEREGFVREVISEKAPLGEYLRKGAYMFRIYETD